jgi:hypothetical protein
LFMTETLKFSKIFTKTIKRILKFLTADYTHKAPKQKMLGSFFYKKSSRKAPLTSGRSKRCFS